jgi:membrane protease YdiL (CAAX protease family)
LTDPRSSDTPDAPDPDRAGGVRGTDASDTADSLQPADATEQGAADTADGLQRADATDVDATDAAGSAPPRGSGPPGSSIFSLEGRRAPGLYLVGWVSSVGGAALLFLAPLANSDFGRVLLLVSGGAALTLGLASAAGSQTVDRRARDPGRYRGPAPLLVFGVVLAFSTLLSALLVGSGLLQPERPFGFLLGLLLVALGYGVAVWLFAVKSAALSWQEMGWPSADGARLQRGLRSIGVAVAVMVPVTFAISIVGGLLALLLGVEAPDVLPTPRNSADAFAIVLSVAIVAPIGEELFFRGFALTAWLRDLGPRAAVTRSALFFALIHIVNIQAVSFGEGAAQALLQTVVILPLGLVLGWLFLRQGLLGAIGGHMTYNSILLLLLLIRSTLPEAA